MRTDQLPGPETTTSLWTRLARRSVRGRAELLLALLDAALVVTSYSLGLLVRSIDTAVPTSVWMDFRYYVPIALVVHLVANWFAGLYGPVWQHASMREARQLLAAGIGATAILIGVVTLGTRIAPLSVTLFGGLAATALFGSVRFQSRLFAFRRSVGEGTRVVVVGAGRAAALITQEADLDETDAMEVVAYVDDDPAKVGRRVRGRPVAGTVADLAEVVTDFRAEQVLLAITDASPLLVQQVADATAALQVPMKVVPGVAELVNGSPRLRDIRDLQIDDVLGRQQVTTDLDAVRELLEGKRVLVTGGGGSIGSEIVRQVHGFGPAALGILDVDETHIHDAAAAIGNDCWQLLADVTRRGQVDGVFEDFAPDIVFHAAAKKHVPLLEDHVCRAIETNVIGTANVMGAARAHGVQRVVFVSTDKAVRPANVMGATKRLGEQLVLAGRPDGAAWSAVRFGNVLGSRGSVVPTFVRQIQEGGPVTVTHEDMTRFFMSIPEAVQLVLQSAALSTGGEIFMLDMGEPVRIVDLAKRMVTLAGHRPDVDIEIDVIGLRPGEKMTEELHVPEESPEPTSHPKIMRLTPPLLAAKELEEATLTMAAAVRDDDELEARHALFDIVTAGTGGDDPGVDVTLSLGDHESSSAA